MLQNKMIATRPEQSGISNKVVESLLIHCQAGEITNEDIAIFTFHKLGIGLTIAQELVSRGIYTLEDISKYTRGHLMGCVDCIDKNIIVEIVKILREHGLCLAHDEMYSQDFETIGRLRLPKGIVKILELYSVRMIDELIDLAAKQEAKYHRVLRVLGSDRMRILIDRVSKLLDELRETGVTSDIHTLELPQKLERALLHNGVLTIKKLANLTDEELEAIPKIGPSSARTIRVRFMSYMQQQSA
ncbi:hypothetical protein HY620_02485 [Candidatus Uhrbacteria bacterium]|nr:hypothetical protein [Candidatus Uhrbacteria bacterium]